MAERNADCPCANRDCHRNRDCEPCRDYHHGRGSMTACERVKSDMKRTHTLKVARPATFRTAGS